MNVRPFFVADAQSTKLI